MDIDKHIIQTKLTNILYNLDTTFITIALLVNMILHT